MSQVASTGVYLAVSLTHISKEIYNLLVEIHIAYVKHILSHFFNAGWSDDNNEQDNRSQI